MATSTVITTVTSNKQKPKLAHPTLPVLEPDLNSQELFINDGPNISETVEDVNICNYKY